MTRAHSLLHAGIFDAQEMARLEYEALQAEKRDRMNGRLTVWGILLTLISAFCVVGIQSGPAGYMVALYPMMSTYLGGHAGHSEHIIRQIKRYLLKCEKRCGHIGYEHFNAFAKHWMHGIHRVALCAALLSTDMLCLVVVVLRLFLDRVPVDQVVLLLIVALTFVLHGCAMLVTWLFLRAS